MAVAFIMAWNEADGEGVAEQAARALAGFRRGLWSCFTARADALFELCDAVLCAPGRVSDLARLSLAPEFRRGHGALYDRLNAGRLDVGRLELPRRLPITMPLRC